MPFSFGTLLALGFPILLVTQWLWPLYVNYRIGMKTGFPVVVSPFNPDNTIFGLFMLFFGPLVEKAIPIEGVRLSIFGWSWRHKKNSIFTKYGKNIVIVTPGRNQLWCADPAMSQTVLARRKDFMQSTMITKIFSLLGMNVFTSNHEDWARQRRLVAPQLNERISEVVWEEGSNQASGLVDHMLSQPGSSSRRALSGLRTIAMNVLLQVGYGDTRPWDADEAVYHPKADLTYVDTIALFSKFTFLAAVVPRWLLRQPFMSPTIQTIGSGLERIPLLTKEVLAKERKQAAAGTRERDNMLSMLVRFSDSEKNKTDGASGQFLNESEISGNLFIFTAAGFDTTANTLGYAITLLAAYPEWQVWVQQELDYVWSNLKGREDKLEGTPEYSSVFPKLTRALAIMYETLRLYPASLFVSRDTDGTQVIKVANRTHELEGKWRVNTAIVGLHYDPKVWGSDYDVFRPSRWITPESTLEDSHIITPAKGSFCPWGGGPRICPGMKMSQVEFTSVMTTLLRRCRVEPVVQQGETLQDAQDNLIKLADDSVQKISMQMQKPDKVVLKWYKR